MALIRKYLRRGRHRDDRKGARPALALLHANS